MLRAGVVFNGVTYNFGRFDNLSEGQRLAQYPGQGTLLFPKNSDTPTVLNYGAGTFVFGIAGNIQFGSGPGAGGATGAYFWRGTAESMTPLYPAGTISRPYAIKGNNIVGQANGHAVVWDANTLAITDLHEFVKDLKLDLSANTTLNNPVASIATDVDSDGSICGYAIDHFGNNYPVLWKIN
jgi:hypothetical protein